MHTNRLTDLNLDGAAGLGSGDPILDRVQRNLTDHGSDVMQFLAASAQTAQAGANLMGQIIGLMAQSQSHEAPVVTNSAQKSSAGPAIAAGLAGLAVGAGIAATALGRSGNVSQFAPGVRGSQMPETKFYPGPEKEKGTVETKIENNTTVSPVAYVGASAPDEFVAKTLAPPIKKSPIKTKPAAKPEPKPEIEPKKPIITATGMLDCDPSYMDCLADEPKVFPPVIEPEPID